MDTYESLCDEGRAIVESMDRDRWRLGDLAITVSKHYGSDTINEFAKDIGISKSAAKQYRRCAEFYEKDTRVSFLDTNITYSHFRVAIRARIQYLAIDWLHKASSNGWTVDELAAQMSKSGLVRDYLLKETALDSLVIDMLRELQGDVYLSVWREKQVERI